jgi:signal peptidase I
MERVVDEPRVMSEQELDRLWGTPVTTEPAPGDGNGRGPGAPGDDDGGPGGPGGPGDGDASGTPGAQPASESSRLVRQGIEWVILVGVAVAIALLVKAFVVQAFYIPSGSMEDTLHVSDRVLVNKLSYRFGDPSRGDIVVFEAPPGEATAEIKDLIKRVIGLPGDVVEGHDGHVFVNGQQLEEPYVKAPGQSRTFGPFYVPKHGDHIAPVDDQTIEVNGTRVTARLQTTPPRDDSGAVEDDEYYVLGDNRLDSKDSTSFGPIRGDTIIGRAFLRVWPLGDFGRL